MNLLKFLDGMKISKKITLGVLIVVFASVIAMTASAQTASSTLTRAEMRAKASSTRMANIAARQAQMIQKAMADADKEITNRINSLNDLLSKIKSMKNVSDTDKASITSSVQNEIATLTALKAKIDADTGTTTLKDDLKSVTADYRVYALVEPQIRILAAADRINQIVSLMTTVENKLQTRITQLQSAGVDASSVTSTMSDIAAKIADATNQATNAVSTTASLVPDEGNATVASSNTAVLKAARADIKTGDSDLQAARKDMNNVVSVIRKIVPKGNMTATTTASSTVAQ